MGHGGARGLIPGGAPRGAPFLNNLDIVDGGRYFRPPPLNFSEAWDV